MLKLGELAAGAAAERFDLAVQEVLENIIDPNTDAKKARKVTMTFTFEPEEGRGTANVKIDTKVSLAPTIGVGTKILVDKDNYGQAVGKEFIQPSLFDDRPPEPDKKVSYLQRKQSDKNEGA